LNIHGAIHAKIHDIINIFKLKSLSLLCITETGKFTDYDIPTENQKITKEIIPLTYNTKDNTPQVRLTLISDTNGRHSGSGVSVLLSQHFYNHIQKISCFHGRLISIDFGFKGRRPTRIISIYFPTKSQNNKQISHDTTRKITELLDEATRKNYEIIILGDFNRDINKYLLRNPSSSRTPHILNIIDKFHLTDIIGKFFLSPKPTWFSSTSSSRIDLILSTQNIFDSTYYANSLDTESILHAKITDHHLIFFLTDFFNAHLHNNPPPNASKSSSHSHINYPKVTKELWDYYNNLSNTIHVNNLFTHLTFIQESADSFADINHLTTYIVKLINDIKRQIFTKDLYTTFNNSFKYPLKIAQLNNDILKVTKILYYLNKLNPLRNPQIQHPFTSWSQKVNDLWPLNRHKLLRLTTTYSPIFDNIPNPPSFITMSNYSDTILSLRTLVSLLRTKFKEDLDS